MTYSSIAVATDFSEASRPALLRAARLAIPRGVAIRLLHVDEISAGAANGDARAREITAEERNAVDLLLGSAREELERAGARVLEVRLAGVPHEAIVDAVRAGEADLLVCGTHGRTGLRRLLMGSVAEICARESAIPVLIARGPAEHDFERVLVATDLDERGERAAKAACELAAPGSIVDIVHFVPLLSLASPAGRFYASMELPRLQAEAWRRGNALIDRLGNSRVEPRFTVEIGDPRDGVLRRIDERHHDLVVVGSHGRGGLSRVAFGSVSEGIVRHAPCSVLVVR